MATQGSMTLSSAAYAKLSPHPYLLANLQPPSASSPSSRANGRQPAQARPPSVNTASLAHAHGSAVVRTGDTTVVCGVRGETLATSQIPNYRPPVSVSVSVPGSSATAVDELRDYDLVVPNIELATGSAPEFLPGVPPTALAQTLSARVYSLLHSSGVLDVRDLRIYHDHDHDSSTGGEEDEEEEGDEHMQDVETGEGEGEEAVGVSTRRKVKAYWVLYVDLLFISLDGNPFDAAWAAVLAALRDTRLPRAYWDADREVVLCARGRAPRPLAVSGLPVACTAAVFAARDRLKQSQQSRKSTTGRETGAFWILVDPDRFEESLCDETVTVVVDRSGKEGEEGGKETRILGISKSGGTMVGAEVVRRLVRVAEDRWLAFRDAF